MLTERAIVVSYQNGLAKVKCQTQSACGSCAAKESCGTSALSELTGARGEHLFTIETMMPLRIGQQVEIGLAEKSILFSALLLYIVPLLTVLIMTFVSAQFTSHELLRALFIFASAAIAFIVVRFYSKSFNKHADYQPILLRILS